MNENELVLPDKLQDDMKKLLDSANALAVIDEETEAICADIGRTAQAMKNEIKEQLDPICNAAHKAWKRTTDFRAKQLEVPDRIIEIAKKKTTDYRREIERKADEERRRLQAEADELARKMREQAEADKKRATEEALKAAEAGDEVGFAVASSELEYAEAVAEIPPVSAPVIPPSMPKPRGLGVRKEWKAEIVSHIAFLTGLANGTVPTHLVKIDYAALNRFARDNEGRTPLPGVRFFEDIQTSFRA